MISPLPLHLLQIHLPFRIPEPLQIGHVVELISNLCKVREQLFGSGEMETYRAFQVVEYSVISGCCVGLAMETGWFIQSFNP